MDTSSGIGLELIEKEVTKILFDNLNDEIDTQQTIWATRDTEWNEHTGQEPSSIDIEYVEPENFHRGHKPSLIENPPKENYPNVSVMVYQARPTEDILDQASNFLVQVDVELMIKGDSEAEVNARIHRTSEAVHQVLTANSNLNGFSYGWENDPIVQITDIFKRREDVSHGSEWWWQASRIRYSLIRHNRLPISG